MALKDESRRAFQQALKVFPSKVTFNGITKDCISQEIQKSEEQQLVGYVPSIGQQITMDEIDFAAFEKQGIEEKSSLLKVNDDEPLQFVQKQTHPNSAVVHLILAASL
jgi:hypothetical protein